MFFGTESTHPWKVSCKILTSCNSKSQEPKIDSHCSSLWDTRSHFSQAPQDIRSKLFVVSHPFLLSKWVAQTNREKTDEDLFVKSLKILVRCTSCWRLCTKNDAPLLVTHENTYNFHLPFSLHVPGSLPKLFMWRRTPSIARRRRHFRHTWQREMMARSGWGSLPAPSTNAN